MYPMDKRMRHLYIRVSFYCCWHDSADTRTKVISILLSREFGTLFTGDMVTESRLLALELSRLITGSDPVQDVLLAVGL